MKILHIIRDNKDQLADLIMKEIENIEDVEQTMLMIQDGVYMKPGGFSAFACAEDVSARGVDTELPLVDQDQIVEMIFDHDKVITW
jgi:sulfur relay protein TusB/DsrH